MALVRFYRRADPNEALAWRNLQRAPESGVPLTDFLNQWLSLEENRHTWICLHHRQITGLLSARIRTGNSAWEIDRLLVDPAGDPAGDLLALLDFVATVGGNMGMEKLFLRAPADSEVVELARHAGFIPYKTERLYRREEPLRGYRTASARKRLGMRPRARNDELALFQLYQRTTRPQVMHHEGITFQEWQAARERDPDPLRRKDYVLEREGRLVVWAHCALPGSGGQFLLLVDPDYSTLQPEALRFTLGLMENRTPIGTLVPAEATTLHALLETEGFEYFGEYTSLVKHLTVRVRQFALAPVQA
jgi:hypothetical protein